jgi:hypothetical protein
VRLLPAPFVVSLPFKRIVAVRPAAHQPKYQGAAQTGLLQKWSCSIAVPIRWESSLEWIIFDQVQKVFNVSACLVFARLAKVCVGEVVSLPKVVAQSVMNHT